MLFGKPTPMIPGQILPDPREDYRKAEKIGFYRVSENAFYQPDGSYLLRSVILNARSSAGSTHVSGCCAGSVPVSQLVIFTENQTFKIICDSEKIAARLAGKLAPL